MKIKVKGFKPTESQRAILSAVNTHKYVIASYSRQQGKSTIASYLVIKWLLSPKEDIIYFTPTYNLAKNFFGKITKLLPKELVTKSNASELVIEMKTQSTLRFFSNEAAQTARGSNCTRMIIDEAAYQKDDIDGQSFWYNIVTPLLKAHGKTCLIISTPFSTSGFFYELAQKAINGEKGYIFLKRTIYEDELITKEEIEELKKGYPELAWKTEFECEWVANAMSVFPTYDDRFIDNFKFNKTSKLYIGVDLSSVGEDDTIVSIVNDSQMIQFIIKGDFDSRYRQIATIINEYNPIGTYIESNGVGSPQINEILKLVKRKSNVLPFTTTNETKKEQVGLLSVAIQNKTISFDKNNTLLYSQFGSFTYKLTKNGNITYAAQGALHDDAVLSAMIAMQAREDFKYNTNISFAKANRAFKIQ